MIAGLLLVAATALAGSRYGRRLGVCAALLVLAGLFFSYDVDQAAMLVAALWMAAAGAAIGSKRNDLLLTIVTTGVAIVLRPAFALLAVPVAVFLAFRPERMWTPRLRSLGMYVLASVAASIVARFVPGIAGPAWQGFVMPALRSLIVVAVIIAAALALLPGAVTALFSGLLLVDALLASRSTQFATALVMLLVAAAIDAAIRRVVFLRRARTAVA